MYSGNILMLPTASKHVKSTNTGKSEARNTRLLLRQMWASPLKLRSAINNVAPGKVILKIYRCKKHSSNAPYAFSPLRNFCKEDMWAKSGKLATTRCSSANRNDFESNVQRLLLGYQTVNEDRFKPYLLKHKATLEILSTYWTLKPPLMLVAIPSQYVQAGGKLVACENAHWFNVQK
jgi:hypothetical protein